MNKLIPFFLSIVLAFSSCTQEEKEPNVALPTALEYDIEVSKSTEGLVNVTVSAILANYYTVSFFEDEEPAVVEIKEGEEASYQFKSSGTYAVRIRAHATYQHFIEEEDSVTVEVKDTGNNGNNGELPKTGYTTPLSYNGYNLVWQDDFNGNSLSTTDWNYEIGTGSNGWGNNELQYYRKENTEVKDGYLIITAKKENFGGREYTSSRLTTQGKQSFKYGRIDIRAALPYGQGIWPALWMLGSSHSSVGWPRCGEIDIMEMVGGNVPGGGDSRVHGTVHWDNNGSYASYGKSDKLSSGIFADEWHVFSIVWDDQAIRWYRDDKEYNVIDITGPELSEFQEEFFLIFNVAVGGNWPGDPNASTQFPQRMAVDYVRVFQKP